MVILVKYLKMLKIVTVLQYIEKLVNESKQWTYARTVFGHFSLKILGDFFAGLSQ